MCCSIMGSCTSWLNMRVVVIWSAVVLLVSKFQSSRLLVFSEDLFFLYGSICFLPSFSMLGAYFLLTRIGVTSMDIQDYLVGLISAYIMKTLYFGRYAFAAISFIAETFIFLYVGMDALDTDKWKSGNARIGAPFTGRGVIQIWRILNVSVDEEEVPPSIEKSKQGNINNGAMKNKSTLSKWLRGRPRKKPIVDNEAITT